MEPMNWQAAGTVVDEAAGAGVAVGEEERFHHMEVTPKAMTKATKPAHAKHANPRTTSSFVVVAASLGVDCDGEGLAAVPVSS